jgi:His/Glu/Gln/Arg/opine family amino acid ABC transporter permease subunit
VTRRHGDAGPSLRERPPDTKGATSPFAVTVMAIGAVSLALVLVGTFVIQAAYAIWGGPVSQACLDRGIIPFTPNPNGPPHGSEGALGICHIVEGLTSTAQRTSLILALILAAVAVVVGFGTYRRMDTRRRRSHVITGAVFGLQAINVGVLVLIFISGSPEKAISQYFNLEALKGYGPEILSGMKHTLELAVGGELLGIAIGLPLALLVISQRRAVRAPARFYINMFRGTPLLVQLSFGYYGVNLGLGLHNSTFTIGTIVLGMNAGAYLAEVFRAGIQSIDRGQMEAARSTGMTYLQAMRYAIIPQAVRRVIPPLLNEYVILIKDTSLVVIMGEVLGSFELFAAGQDIYSSTFSATGFVAIAIGYLLITLPMIGVVNLVERRLRSGLVTISTQGGG